MFFSQEGHSATLAAYRHLFFYAQSERAGGGGDDTTTKVLGRIEEEEPVRHRVITAAPAVSRSSRQLPSAAIFLTLGNAMQVAFSDGDGRQAVQLQQQWKQEGQAVIKADSVKGTPCGTDYRVLSTLTK